MNRFINQTILFFVFLFCLATSLFYFPNKWIRENANFKLENSTDYVVFGHSHPACSFNDSLIQNFQNCAKPGESYFYTYPKVKNIVLQNPQIDTIFIELTNDQIREGMNNWIWGDKFMTNRYPEYSPFMEREDHALLIAKNSQGFLSSFSISMRKNLERALRRDINYIDPRGGFTALTENKTDSLLKLIEQPFSQPTRNEKQSVHSIAYLKRIVSFCIAHQKTVFFVRSPQHAKYTGIDNEKQLKEVLTSKFPEIEFLDFNNFPIKDSEFADLDHLNYKGARKFSKWFNRMLEKGLLKEKNQQKFIDAEIAKYAIYLANQK